MTTAQAQARIAKLLALAEPGRGGTPNERAVALQKAQALAGRHGISLEGARRAHAQRERASRAWRPPSYAAPARGPAYSFDVGEFMRTGKSTDPRVRVHRHDGPRSWKIEYDPAAESEARAQALFGDRGKRKLDR